MTSRIALYNEINQLIRFRSIAKVKEILVRRYQVDTFSKLSLEQLSDSIKAFKEKIALGEL